MAKQRNFLLGNGHRLTSPVRIGKKIEPKPPPYNLAEAKTRLSDQFIAAAASFSELPNAACPDGYAVGIITLHPEYIAKSFFPADLLREARMEAIGSRPSRVTPEKWKKKKDPEDVPTTDLFVAARREDFQSFARELASITDEDKSANDLFKVEAFHAPKPSDRVQKIRKSVDQPMLEVVLHTSGIPRPARILQAFEAYAEMLGLDPDLDRRFEVSGLCFLPVRAPRSKIEALSNFSFLRTIREMPELRPLRPIIRTSAKSKPFPVTMPTAPPIDKQLRAAVFDGGISDTMHHSPYAQSHEPSGIGAVVDGHGSSSSLWSKFNSARNQVIACALLRARKKIADPRSRLGPSATRHRSNRHLPGRSGPSRISRRANTGSIPKNSSAVACW